MEYFAFPFQILPSHAVFGKCPRKVNNCRPLLCLMWQGHSDILHHQREKGRNEGEQGESGKRDGRKGGEKGKGLSCEDRREGSAMKAMRKPEGKP